MPERVRDRPVRSTERLLMLTRTDRYGHPEDSPSQPNDVWRLPTATGTADHGARFSVALAAACLQWCPPGPVLDPFSGSASTGVAALQRNREYVGVDLVDDFNRDAAIRLDNVPRSV
jgi:site-specific DNA-methyltransferase (cytosine-N4-specific)